MSDSLENWAKDGKESIGAAKETFYAEDSVERQVEEKEAVVVRRTPSSEVSQRRVAVKEAGERSQRGRLQSSK